MSSEVHVLGAVAGVGHLSDSFIEQSGKKVKLFCHPISVFSDNLMPETNRKSNKYPSDIIAG